MKDSILSISINTALKIFVIVALIVAASTKQQYSYYTLLRWLVMITSFYLAYSSYEKKQFGLVIYFAAISLMFNPFEKFWFQKQTWHLIDYIVASITLLTMIYDWILFLKQHKDKTPFHKE